MTKPPNAHPPLDLTLPPPTPRGAEGAPAQYGMRALAFLGLALLGLLSGWASGILQWKVLLGLLVGAFMTLQIAVRPLVGCVFLAVTLPLLDLVPTQLAGMKGVNPLNLILMVVVAAWLGHAALDRRNPFSANPVNLPLMAFSLVLLGSLAFTAQHVPAAHLRAVTDDLKTSLTSFLPFFIAAGVVRTEKQRRVLFYALAVMVILVSLRSMVEYGVDISHGARRDRLRLVGMLGQANEFGGYLALYIPAILVMGLGEKNRFGRLALLAGGAVAFLVLLLTQSRGGIVACMAALLALALFRERKLLVLLVAGLLLAPFWLPSTVVNRFEGTRVVSQQSGDAALDQSSQARLDMWKGGWDLFLKNPAVGQGFGSWYDALGANGFEGVRGRILAPHSTYMRTLAENGLLGIGCLAWMVAALARLAVRRRWARSAFDTRLHNALFGSVVALVGVNVFGTRLYNIEEMGYFWMLAGLVAACGTAARAATPSGGAMEESHA